MEAENNQAFVPAVTVTRFAYALIIALLSSMAGAQQTAAGPAQSLGSRVRLTPTASDNGIIQLAVHAPAEPILTDPQGRQTGYDPTTKTAHNEIPNAGYDPNSGEEDAGTDVATVKVGELDVLHPADGTYQLKIIGTAEGRYDLYLSMADSNGNPDGQWNVVKVPIHAGEVHKFEITYEKTPQPAAMQRNRLSGAFDGGGQHPKDVNKFLTYANPSDSPVTLPAGTRTFPLLLFYGSTTIPSTLAVKLNGTLVTRWFTPTPGGFETVQLPLQAGKNIVEFSIDGTVASGRTVTDSGDLVINAP